MKVYELTVLVHPDLEMNLEPATKKLEKIVTDNGGKIVKLTDDGKKRTAYEIEGQEFAIYHFYDVELPPEAISKVSNALNIADEFIRYLIVAKDEQRKRIDAQKEAKKDADRGDAEKETKEEK